MTEARLKHCVLPFVFNVTILSCTIPVYDHFAATEYRNWLFFYSLPCMKDVLDDEYYQHYALLVGGIVLLSGRSISPEQLDMAGNLLIHFVEMFDAYYGE